MRTITKITIVSLLYVLLLMVSFIFTMWLIITTYELLMPLLFLLFIYLFIAIKINKQSNKLEQLLNDKYDESNDYLS